jgi:hypothetical protein
MINLNCLLQGTPVPDYERRPLILEALITASFDFPDVTLLIKIVECIEDELRQDRSAKVI